MNKNDKKLMMQRFTVFLVLTIVLQFTNFGFVFLSEVGLKGLAEKVKIEKARAADTVIFLTGTASTTWVVPSDWNDASNTIQVVGGGGSGGGGGNDGQNVTAGGGGGAGGVYAKAVNVNLPESGTVTIAVGAGQSGGAQETAGTAGGDTYLCNASSNCASIAGTAVVVGGKGGGAGGGALNNTSGTAGTVPAGSVGSTINNGGSGDKGGVGGTESGGGGGAGGGAGGQTAAGTSGGVGLTGGNRIGGNGGAGGAGGTTGGGAGGSAGAGGDQTTGGTGGVGSVGTNFDATHGAGGAGGGAGGGGRRAVGGVGGAGGNYGSAGGGGGGTHDNTGTGNIGGASKQGIIVITYTPLSSDSSPPTPNPMTFASAPNDTGTSTINMSSTVGSDATTPVNYIFINTPCTSNGGTGNTSSSWQTGTTYTDSGLQANQCYAYTVTARDSVATPNTGTASASSSAYTAAAVPGAPTLSGATTSTLNFTNDANGNPASSPITQFAIFVSSTSPTDSKLQGFWITSTGATSSAETWMSDAAADGLSGANAIKNLATSTTYTFKVKARNSDLDETVLSTAGSGTTNPPTPGTPGTPTYTSVATSTLTINYASSTNTDYYKIERATSSGSFAQITTTTALTYGDTGRTPNTTYFYRLKGTNTGGDGPYSASSSALMLPNFPGTATFASISTSTLTVNWTAPTDGATFYRLERATSSQTYAELATTTALTYADSGRTPNTTYLYRLRSNNATGNGPYNASSSALTLPGISGTPTYTSVSTSTLTVNWTAPTDGAASYKVERATSTEVYAQIAAGVGGTSYGDSSLTASTTYFYRLRATNATGDGSYSATSSVTTASTTANVAPSAPSQDQPVNAGQGLSTTPVFKMTATDADGDTLRYKVTIYSNSGCTTVVQTNDQNSSQTGWSGQNASSSTSYTSGTQGTFTTQTTLSQNTTYYWKASAKDLLGTNTFTDSSTCNSFTTTFGNWTTDSGNWSIVSNQLTVAPASGASVQIHAIVTDQTNGVIEVKAKSSAVGANTGNTSCVLRADTGANRYHLAGADAQNNKEIIGKTISGAYSAITSSTFTFSADTFYELRGYISGTSLQSWINGATALSTTDSALSAAGFLGLAASSTNGSATFTYDNFAFYTSPTITLNNLPAGGSWAARTSGGTVTSCRTAGTWDASTYTGQVPIDYDNGGGSIAVWAGNSTCSAAADATYPSSGLATDIFGGDVYAYSSSSAAAVGATIIATSGITISAGGLVSW